MSTGEKLAVALALNRADWLKELDYYIGEALHRVDTWVPFISLVETALKNEELLPLPPDRVS